MFNVKEKPSSICCWQIFTVNAAGVSVHIAEIQADHADENRAVVVSKLRELVMFDLSPELQSESDKYIEVQELDLGYSAGNGPVYRAKFICGMQP